MTRVKRDKYEPAERERLVLDQVENPRYDRQITNGLTPFLDRTVPSDMGDFYSSRELEELLHIRGTERDIEARMPVKMTRHYFELARKSPALQKLVKASPDETLDLEGSDDPANQMYYSPIDGLLHKYEMGLIYVISTCSAHCRFCYREELIARKDVQHRNGASKKKGLAQVKEVTDYIRVHNTAVASNGGFHPVSGRGMLEEILLSGGDPMVLPNSKLAGWFTALAEAGVKSIRVGTKELSFFPDRFDKAFLAMLDRFHDTYPHVTLRLMTHFSHPDEILDKDENGDYIEDAAGCYRWYPGTRRAVEALASRSWVSLANQSPIIKGVNDDVDALHLMQRTLKPAGIENHYFFGGRDIIAYRAFNVPIETAWQIVNNSQKGLSGVEAHARLALSHYKGKAEVVTVTDRPILGLAGAHNGVVVFKILRSPADASDRGKVCIVGRNPDAVWFDDYEDRILFDEAGLFDTSTIADTASPTPTPGSAARDRSDRASSVLVAS